jgi:hypothetical protein
VVVQHLSKFRDADDERQMFTVRVVTTPTDAQRCRAGSDGEGCFWTADPDCPQLRDNEPGRTGRHCPLDTEADDE